MEVVIKSLIAGLSVGLFFGILNLPIPAPGVFSGVAGIIGIFVGYAAIKGFIW